MQRMAVMCCQTQEWPFIYEMLCQASTHTLPRKGLDI